MKKILHLILLGIFLNITSCNKAIEFTPLAMPVAEDEVVAAFEPFSVTTSAPTYKTGEPVRFYFTGNTESIDFYSGEKYHQYDYKDGRIDAIFNPFITFNLLSNPIPPGVKNFYLMVSTNYNPATTATYADIGNSTWENVPIGYPTVANTWTSAGTIDLSKYVVEGKPLYIGFKYVNTFSTATPPVHQAYYWYVRNLLLNNKLPNNTNVELASQTTAGFVDIQQNLVSKGTYTVSADRFVLVGNKNATAGTEHWAVSKAFISSPFQIGGDLPIPIKSIGASKLISYSQTYSKPGAYSAHFVIKQKNAAGTVEDLLKTVNISITQ